MSDPLRAIRAQLEDAALVRLAGEELHAIGCRISRDLSGELAVQQLRRWVDELHPLAVDALRRLESPGWVNKVVSELS